MDISLPVLSLLVLAAFVAGLVDAIAGGGGLVTVPALLLTGAPVPLVLGTNKGQSVFGSGSALLAFWRQGRIEPGRVLRPFVAAFAGALLGAWLVTLLPPTVLRPVVLVLLGVVAVFLALRRDFGQTPRAVPLHRDLRAAVLAFCIGGYDGFFGPGTGTFLVLGSVWWLGDGLTAASAHAKVGNFASNLASMLLFAWKGTVVWPVALPMAAAQATGAALGAKLAVKGGDVFVRKVVLMVVVGLVCKLGWDLLQQA